MMKTKIFCMFGSMLVAMPILAQPINLPVTVRYPGSATAIQIILDPDPDLPVWTYSVPTSLSEFDLEVPVRTSNGTAASQNINFINVSIMRSPWQPFQCSVVTDPTDTAHTVWLKNDLGDWEPGAGIDASAPGDMHLGDPSLPNEWSNSQCTLKDTESSITFAGDTVTLKLRIRPAAQWTGPFYIWVYSAQQGSWTYNQQGNVRLNTPNQPPIAISYNGSVHESDKAFQIHPAGTNRATFFVRFREPNGVHATNLAYFTVGTAMGAPGNCTVVIAPTTNSTSLLTDQGGYGGWMLSGPQFLAEYLVNGYCKVYAAGTNSYFLSPSDLVVKLDIEFQPNYQGTKYLYANMVDSSKAWVSASQNQLLSADGGYATFTPTLPPSNPLPVQDFRTCIGRNGSGGVCQLAVSNHVIDASNPTFVIERSNMVVRGTSRDGTTLNRDTSYYAPLMSVSREFGALSGITISDFTFNGNGTVGSVTPNNLDVAASAGSIRIVNNIFKNAPLSSIALHPESGQTQPVTGVTIENNMFFGSNRAPIHIDSGAFANKESKACDEMANYDTEPRIVRNVTIRRNFFEGNHTGAFGLNGQNIWVQENLMINNYDSGSQDCSGGVVAVASCSRTAYVLRNHIYNAGIAFRSTLCPEPGSTNNGRNPNQGTNMVMVGGLELWGRDMHVEGNVIRYLPDEGIFAGSVKDLFVQNSNVIENTSRSFVNPGSFLDDRAGVRILNKQVTCSDPTGQNCNCFAQGNQCHWLFRGTDGLRIDQGNLIRNVGTRFQPFAVQILFADSLDHPQVGEPERNTFRNVFIQGNVLSPNRFGEFCKHNATVLPSPSVVPAVSANCTGL